MGVGNAAAALAIARVHGRSGRGTHTIIASAAEDALAFNGGGHLGRAGLVDHVEVIVGFSGLTLPQLMRDGFEADFALIDGGKRFEEVFMEFLYVDSLLVNEGIMALTAADEAAVGALLEFIDEARAYEVRSLPGDQLAVLRKLGQQRTPHALLPRWTRAVTRNGADGLLNGSHASVTEMPAAAAVGATPSEPATARALYIARAQVEELKLRVAELGTSLVDAEQRVGELCVTRSRLSETQARLDASQAAHERTEHWLRTLKDSFSWRLTAPLRFAKRLARALFGR